MNTKEELEQRDRRIAELKAEIDEARAVISDLKDHLSDVGAMMEQWKEGFGMVLRDDGVWTWGQDFFTDEVMHWYEKHTALLREWNKFVGLYNASVGAGRNVGRPLAASEAQCEQVRMLHSAGMSLREIVEETSLGLATVRTIVGKGVGTDRTTRKHLEKIGMAEDRARMRSWTTRKRTRDALPKRLHEIEKRGEALRKEANRGR